MLGISESPECGSIYGMMACIISLLNGSFVASAVITCGPDGVHPHGITMIIGGALPSAIRLYRMSPARPTVDQEMPVSPPPCSR